MASAPIVALLAIAAAFILPHRSDATARRLTELVTTPVVPMSFHNGDLLTGPVSFNLLYYGTFTPSQRAVIADFFSSFSTPQSTSGEPTVASWLNSLGPYYSISKSKLPTLSLGKQTLDESCSLGKSLKSADIAALAARAGGAGVAVVLTAADVLVEEFCTSQCASHWSSPVPARMPYIWVGNPATQCPGQCAWPFHKPIYGPQSPALVAPNGDVGVDGMVINLAVVLAGVATNPYGDGFYQGAAAAPMEAASACSGTYGAGAYPGYPGKLRVDGVTGASYNAVGGGGREFLLPAIFDPYTSQCSALV